MKYPLYRGKRRTDAKAWEAWFDALARAAAALPTSEASPPADEVVHELRAIRERLLAIGHAHDDDALRAIASDDRHPRHAWAKDALERRQAAATHDAARAARGQDEPAPLGPSP